MNIIRVFVRRPVLTTMVLLLLTVLGFYSYQRLAVELMPRIDVPVVVVTTVYPGASPSDVESEITKKIEDEVSTIANVDNLTSTSMENLSRVIIEFDLETDVDMNAIDVKDKVDAIQPQLPEDAEESVISKFDIASTPVMELAVSGPRDLAELYDIADNVVKERLSRIGGVADVGITGKRQREIRVVVEPERVKAYGLSILDILGVVASYNLNAPLGRITRGANETSIRLTGEAESPAELAEFRVPLPSGGSIPLSEVADIKDTTEEAREFSSYNGQPVIGLSINKRSDGNTVKIGGDVREAVEEIKPELPPDVNVHITNDLSLFVSDAVQDVLKNIMLGILLTSILLFIFLHNWRQTLIAVVSMPVSVIATFLLIESSGFTVNVMSLLALGVSVGVLVTNSIVVIENITRFVHDGMDPYEAAEKGTAEVAIAVLASTLTNIVVFTPIAFMSGIIGRVFLQFGMTVVYATIFSLVICFTMVPMLAARLLRPKKTVVKEENLTFALRVGRKWDHFYERLSAGYRGILSGVLAHRGWLSLGTLALLAFAIYLFTFIGGEFMPPIDQNMVTVRMELPAGTSLERTAELTGRIEKRMLEFPEVQGVMIKAGGGQRGVEDAYIVVQLVKGEERERSARELMGVMRSRIADIPDAEISLSSSGEGSGPGGADLVMQVLSSDSEKLSRAGSEVFDILNSIEGLVEVQTSREEGKPEIAVSPLRAQLAERGITSAALARTLRTAYEGTEAGVYREKGEEFDIVVRMGKEKRTLTADLEDFPVVSPGGSAVPLSDLGSFRKMSGDAAILHRDKRRMIEITANIASGSLSEARAKIDSRLADLDLPGGVTVQYGGNAEIQDESFEAIFEALVLAIILVYIVMAAILESFVHPFTVMITLPLGLIGVGSALFFSGQTINIMSLMAVVMLVGIVVNNAILILDYTSSLRKKGVQRDEALLAGSTTRLRPIIIANLAIAVGMIPQAVGGAGAEYRTPMAVVLIGGVLVAALFTLFVIPAAYTLIDKLSIKSGN